ncbi:PREDICTED: uncharacterized protein LOC106816757 [Priapulus caudatus]|uniref:Uncharacterized protein LOC106816757 n=1 Tax=Priapulus caudatus TaxID=37621 RepID=A0ABM1EXE4_PRICU|nr:PREDICTED: uncharacterized protein LOC106816757 [Priapulus caudatus]
MPDFVSLQGTSFYKTMLSARLFNKAANNAIPPCLPAPATPPLKVRQSGAARMKKCRIKRNRHPVAYQLYLEKERERSCTRRQEPKSDEQKEHEREISRIRSQKYRNKCKAEGKKISQRRRKVVLKTRKQTEEKRKYNRDKKRESRSKMHSQKVRRVQEYDRNRKKPDSDDENVDENVDPSVEDEENNGCDVMSPQAKRQAASRIRDACPNSRKKFATALAHVVSTLSPRKRKALGEAGLSLQSAKKQKVLEETFDTVKGELSKSKRKEKKSILNTLAPGYSDINVGAKELGVSTAFLEKCSRLPAEEEAKRSDALKPDVIDLVEDFYQQPEVSVVLPDRKLVKKNKCRRVLQKTIRNTYEDFKAEHPDVKVGRSKFASLKPTHVKPSQDTPVNQCICEYCANFELKIKALLLVCDKTKSTEVKSKITDRFKAVSETLCPKLAGAKYHQRECVGRKCNNCGVDIMKKNLEPLQSDDDVMWYKWGLIEDKNKACKSYKGIISLKGSVSTLVDEFCSELETLASHLFVAAWQYNEFKNIVNNIPEDEGTAVMVLDFGQNYACTNQDEAQSAHWHHEQATIHPIVTYYKCPIHNETVKEELVFLSSDKIHDAHAVKAFLVEANRHLREKRHLNLKHEVQFTDGCSSQYKSRLPFRHISEAVALFGVPITRCFFGSRHGKGPSDGVTGVVKSFVRSAVMARRAIVRNASEMYQYCVQELTRDDVEGACCHARRTFFFVEDIERPNEITKTIPGTRGLHCVQTSSDGTVNTRTLACFCTDCRTGKKCHNGYVDSWTNVSIVTGRPTGNTVTVTMGDQVTGQHQVYPGTPHFSGNREDDFKCVQSFLAKSKGFQELQERCTHVLPVVEKYELLCQPKEVSVVGTKSTIDKIAFSLNSCGSLFPVSINADGNCLPRCGSMFAFQHQNYWKEMRVRIAIEMALHSSCYISEEYLNKGHHPNENQKKLAFMLTVFSEAKLPEGLRIDSTHVIADAFGQVAMKTLANGSYMDMWAIFALASVLQCPIQSIYPDAGGKATRDLLNRIVEPRACRDRSAGVATIMWSSIRMSDEEALWTPNHFVACLPMIEDTPLILDHMTDDLVLDGVLMSDQTCS